jgi:ribosomal protein S27E
MPDIGEITYDSHRTSHIWVKCPDCGLERWVQLHYYKHSQTGRCRHCNGTVKKAARLFCEESARWQGGRIKDPHGYIKIKLSPEDFFIPMANSIRYVPEHRLIMARKLNRCLLPWEIVHHINGVKDDNRLENLRLIKGEINHNCISISAHQLKKDNTALRKRIKELEEQLRKQK